MKSILISILLSLLALVLHAQHAGELHNKFSAYKGTFALSYNKDMLDAVDTEFEWNDEVEHVTGDISHIRVLLVSSSDEAARVMGEIEKDLSKHYRKVEEEDMDKDTQCYVHRKGKYVREVHLLIRDSDDDSGILLSIEGDLKVTSAKK